MIPTTKHPFSPPASKENEIPAGAHPTTPRFILSLLATAIYLSIPTVASQALSLILKTVGPTTVIQYLNFACGKPLGHRSENEPQAAVGLEKVAQLLDDDIAANETESHPQGTLSTDEWKEHSPDIDGKVPSYPSVGSSESSDIDPAESLEGLSSPHYGPVSDKIGEACACWLTRWATDVLQLETQDGASSASLLDTRSRSKSLSSFDPNSILAAPFPSRSKAIDLPLIFRTGGLSAKWVSAIVCADTLFVKGERQRYNFARSVLELRRREGIPQHDEHIWRTMFEQGIHYSNMVCFTYIPELSLIGILQTFEDILFISQDASPATHKPYVSPSVLHASHWTQSVQRHHIMQRANSSPSTPTNSNDPSVRDKELGITSTTADLLLEIANEERAGHASADPNKVYFPVLADSSLRIGENGASSPSVAPGAQMSMDDFFNVSQSPTQGQKQVRPADQTPSNYIPTTEDAFFGISAARFSRQACIQADPSSKCRWTPYPPYRFSVEFWDVDLLKEKSRLHSQTIWHAGNLFNVYVQVVRKKGQTQLGIYLHRQSSVDPIPASSAPSTVAQSQTGARDGLLSVSLERASHLRQPSLPSVWSSPSTPHFSPSIHPIVRSGTPAANPNHPRSASPPSPTPSSPSPSSLAFSIPSTLAVSAPQQPYRDPRPAVSAYFAISCGSATGASQTRFSSSPDVFAVSQSWGWKSSTLRTEDFMEVGTHPLPSDVHTRGEEVSFRATVILGIV